MGELENENYDIRFEVKSKDEIGLLGESFNKMSKRLNEVRTQVYISKIKQREAELISLESKINPHFLYNTLDTAYWLTRMEKADESSKLIQSLAKLFRLSLNNGLEDTTVEKEVEHLQHYLSIQKIRYDGVIAFDIEIEQEILEYKVTKLVLQPIIENAIYHGVEKRKGSGSVKIKLYQEDQTLVYEVIDNGVGGDVEALNQLLDKEPTDGHGFAIRNVNDRIKLYSGESYGISFYKNKPSGIVCIARQKCQ